MTTLTIDPYPCYWPRRLATHARSLVGNEQGLKAALGDAHPPKRNTALTERMRGALL